MCQKEVREPLGKTTCFKILKNCSASFRKCLAGLNNVMTDGVSAFDKLSRLVDRLKDFGLPDQKYSLYLNLISSTMNYLKFSYKKNLSFDSVCADHCASFALRNTLTCKHKHSRSCILCNQLDFLLNGIEESINETRLNSVDKADVRAQHHFIGQDIFDWKHHIVRAWCQDQIKYKTLNDLTSDDLYIHMDWAMKFLPTRYREKQEQFFGKSEARLRSHDFAFLSINLHPKSAR